MKEQIQGWIRKHDNETLERRIKEEKWNQERLFWQMDQRKWQEERASLEGELLQAKKELELLKSCSQVIGTPGFVDTSCSGISEDSWFET
jgi:hypothetical protein